MYIKKNAFKGRSESGKLLFDFDACEKRAWNAQRNPSESYARVGEEKRPFIGFSRKYKTPEQLQAAVEAYFRSLRSPIISKYGEVQYDRVTGKMLTKPIPATRTGLIIALGMSKDTFNRYRRGRIADSKKALPDDPRYAQILNEAIMRIDAQAETFLYDRDAGRGAEFYLKCKGGWQSRKEDAETRQIEEKIKLLREEFELKKKVLLGEDTDTELVIQIVRKQKREDDD